MENNKNNEYRFGCGSCAVFIFVIWFISNFAWIMEQVGKAFN